MKTLNLFIASTPVVAIRDYHLFARQPQTYVACSEQPGFKACGSEYSCINESWTCCSSGKGGCPPTEYCWTGNNGEQGCCPNGELCSGGGGVDLDESTITEISALPPSTTVTAITDASANTPSLTVEVTLSSTATPPAFTVTDTLSAVSTRYTPPIVPSVNATIIPSPSPSPLQFTGGAAGFGYIPGIVAVGALAAAGLMV